ncbi:MAG: ABC transporter ATP-binding protein, partial [Planctomycetes bacterium]|nr:ABC transporter ATP-binding protein [Planctomycetota bacterium]
MEPLIRFDDVARAWGTSEVLRGLAFQVAPGEVFALLGRNGSGKTTAVRLLLGQLVPDRGACRVLGHDARALPDALWDGIGWVPDRPGFPARWRAQELLDFEAATRGSFDRDFARRALRELELPAERRVGELSRGQLAQLGLVVAVAQRPRLLVLDEPTLGLDAVIRRQFLEALIELVGDQGTGVLLATHLLGDVERVADRVGVLHEGRLVLDARLEELRGRAQRRRVRLRP